VGLALCVKKVSSAQVQYHSIVTVFKSKSVCFVAVKDITYVFVSLHGTGALSTQDISSVTCCAPPGVSLNVNTLV